MAWHFRDHANPTQYQDMCDHIHLDEKWFFLTQEKEMAVLHCFNQILLNNGDNDYSINHISKEKLECLGQLPDVLDVVEEGAHIFNSNTYMNDTNEDINDEHMTTTTT